MTIRELGPTVAREARKPGVWRQWVCLDGSSGLVGTSHDGSHPVAGVLFVLAAPAAMNPAISGDPMSADATTADPNPRP